MPAFCINGWRGLLRWDVSITLLAMLLIAVFHQSAAEDRFLLNLYYIGIAAAVYVLMRRGALAMAVAVIAVAAATTVGYLYLIAPTEPGNATLNGIRDGGAFCGLLWLCWHLAKDAFHLQSEERRLRVQREIEEKAVATRAAALACTSHEVRSPLAAILTITELLMDESTGQLAPTQKDFLTEIERCGKHLMSLVNDILDYAKAEAGQTKLTLEPVSLPDLITQCVTIAEINAQKNNVKVVQQVDEEIGEVTADPLRLKQIILNLLSNAVKYSPAHGLVRLHARVKDRQVLLSVRDTGPGIATEDQKQLFNPYYQAAKQDRGIGTGLGLAITKLLVELHGGKIAVDSTLGAGSLFTVRFPFESAVNAASEGSDSWSGTMAKQQQDLAIAAVS